MDSEDVDVSVTMLSGEELELVASLEDTVHVLKDQIAMLSGVPAAKQLLCLKAGITVLTDSKRLNELVIGAEEEQTAGKRVKLKLSLTAVQSMAFFLAMVPNEDEIDDDHNITMDLYLAELSTNTLEWFAGLWDAARSPTRTLDQEYVIEGTQYMSRTLGKVGDLYWHCLSDLVHVEDDKSGIPITNPTTMPELVSVMKTNMYPEGTVNLSDGRIDWTNTGEFDSAYEFVDLGFSVSSRFQDHVSVCKDGVISLKHVSFKQLQD